MSWYPWIVFLHVVGMLGFFLAHGTSMAVGFRLKQERDPARIRALLDVSSWSLGIAPSVSLLVGIVAGIAAGIIGGHFGRLWIWVAIVLLAGIAAYMTPEPDPVELERLVRIWNPVPPAVIGFGGFFFIVWLMLFKPF